MSYFKCPKCGKEEFFITTYEILGNWLGKVAISENTKDELLGQPDLVGYMTTAAICNNCNHNISFFNEDLEGLIEHLQKISIVEK